MTVKKLDKTHNAKMVYIGEIDSKSVFETKQYFLGDNRGSWFVVAGKDVYLARYIDKQDAEEHVNALNDGYDPTEEELQEALGYSNELEGKE
ncbi:MAG TPA: hypothetical protein VI911_11265 [Patescibacteria group bacterium]|nr:hypothetical protein [Patescibacteria group bacterium]